MAVIGIASSIGMAVPYFRGTPARDRPPIRFTVSPPQNAVLPTNLQAGISALSPDGRRLAFVAEGKLRILAVDWKTRWPDLPDVPTLEEAGIRHEKVGSWFALAAPAGTPNGVVEKLNAEFVKA